MKNKIESIRSWIRALGVGTFFKGKNGRRFLVFLEVLLAISFLSHPELYYDANVTSFTMRFYADVLTVCGVLWGVLVLLTVKPVHFSEKVNHILNLFLIPITPLVCFLWLEFYNHAQFWGPPFSVPALYQILNLLIYYCIFALLLLICNRVKWAAVIMMLLTVIFGFANYELTVFRSMSFIASDIYSVTTAMSVANTYSIQIDIDTAEYAFGALVIFALLFKVESEKLFSWKKRIAWLVFCGGMSAAFCNVYVYSSFLEDIGVDFRVYRPQYKYRYYGTLLTTVRTFGYLHVEKPEDYTAEKVKKITDTYAKAYAKKDKAVAKAGGSKTEQPNIIVIMNESFADLQTLGDLEVSQDYMPFFRSLTKDTIKGYAYSSVFGGNTANSEFEFLTGNTLAFLPDNSVPYQLFLRSDVAGLTSTLRDQGYNTRLALHPYYKTGYSRYKIYPLMGFQRFYTSDDFDIFTDTVNYHITDEADYEKLISLYESRSDKDSPFYLFNVTMQNHGSYDGSLYETGDDIKIEGSLADQSWATEYLNMIKMSDEALEGLINYFKKIDEPTVIVFFGDHQPDLEDEFYEQLLGTSLDSLEGESLEQLYKVPFLIWANYDIEEQTIEKTSLNYLSTYLADVAGLEKTGYLNYLTGLREKVPAINAFGYWGDDGKFYEKDDKTSPYYKLIHTYNLLEYNNLFGKDDQQTSFFYLNDELSDEGKSTE